MVEPTQFGVCEMTYKGGAVTSGLPAVLLKEKHYQQYQNIVDEAFHQMREELNIRPFNKHSFTLMDLEDLRQNCFILLDGDAIVCGVVCGAGEIDSIVVNTKYQGQGHGRKITEFALAELQKRGASTITLSVTKWNTRAIALYQSMGFEITKEAVAHGVNTMDENGHWHFEFKGEGAEIMRR
ncbi:MAG: GNAT family N-acetyltransferase [Defluviitaleaceae bacterium]|nr:GNAT family N-acetyltransferase [Defluviitaleaceae bacterium]